MTSTPPFSYWLNEPNTVRYSLTTTSWSPLAVRIVTILYRQARRLSRIVRGGTEILLGTAREWGMAPFFCLFVASYPDRCWRYAAGETPTCRWNQYERWLWEENPDESATSTTGNSVFRKSSFARSTRRESTYRWGDCPTAALKARAK